MKKMIILIICFFAAAGISFYYFSISNNAKKINTTPATNTNPARNEVAFYSIIGKSNKLSEKQVQNMDKWR